MLGCEVLKHFATSPTVFEKQAVVGLHYYLQAEGLNVPSMVTIAAAMYFRAMRVMMVGRGAVIFAKQDTSFASQRLFRVHF